MYYSLPSLLTQYEHEVNMESIKYTETIYEDIGADQADQLRKIDTQLINKDNDTK